MNALRKLEDVPLHDAVLHSITLGWKEAKVELLLSAFTITGQAAKRHNLVILDIEETNCPHLSPWCNSVCINAVEEVSGTFRIEMQSGDVLAFKGKGFEFGEVAFRE